MTMQTAVHSRQDRKIAEPISGASSTFRSHDSTGNSFAVNDMQLSISLGNRALQLLKAAHPKLSLGQPNDEYEQEADRVAEQVMRMPKPGLQRKPG